MLINSSLFHILALFLFVNLVHSHRNLNKDQDDRIVSMQQELTKQKINNLQSEINKMNIEIERGFNAKAQVFIDLQNQATKKMEQLEELGKEIHAWNEILKKINEYISKGNNAMVSFNDKVAALMTKMMGFQQQIKAVVSLDTLIVCILSLILVKILKDEFIDQGYQPVSDSTRLPVTEMSSSLASGEREIAQ